eukprot:642631-Amphidinium_carterae.1
MEQKMSKRFAKATLQLSFPSLGTTIRSHDLNLRRVLVCLFGGFDLCVRIRKQRADSYKEDITKVSKDHF